MTGLVLSVVVFGPKGCGKTEHAQRLKRAFGLRTVCDNYDPAKHKRKAFGVLYLTDVDLSAIREGNGRILTFAEAMMLSNGWKRSNDPREQVAEASHLVERGGTKSVVTQRTAHDRTNAPDRRLWAVTEEAK